MKEDVRLIRPRFAGLFRRLKGAAVTASQMVRPLDESALCIGRMIFRKIVSGSARYPGVPSIDGFAGGAEGRSRRKGEGVLRAESSRTPLPVFL